MFLGHHGIAFAAKAVVPRANLPIFPGVDEKAGLGLWSSWPATLAVGFATFGAELLLYFIATKAKDRIGSLALYPLAAFLIAMYVVSLKTTSPGADPLLIAAGSFSMLLLALWAWCTDKHRVTSTSPPDTHQI